MLKRLFGWLRSEEGQAMSEYGLVLAIAAVGVIGLLIAFREKLVALFTNMGDAIDDVTPKPTTTPTTGG